MACEAAQSKELSACLLQSQTSLCDFESVMSKEYKTLDRIISTGQSNELLGRNLTLKELNEMSSDKIDAYYKIYELNYAKKVSGYLNGTIISLYSYAINKVVAIDDIENLQQDLNNSYILNSELRNITGGLARVGGKIWALVELSLTTFKHIRRPSLTEEVKEQCIEQCKEQCKEL